MVGELLQELRKDKGITQAELARVLGVSPLTVSSYECGRSTPDDATKVKISQYFGVSLDYLLGLVRQRVSYQRTSDALLLSADLTPEETEKVAEYIAFLRYQREQKASKAKPPR